VRVEVIPIPGWKVSLPRQRARPVGRVVNEQARFREPEVILHERCDLLSDRAVPQYQAIAREPSSKVPLEVWLERGTDGHRDERWFGGCGDL
jgi:hypothetical protein